VTFRFLTGAFLVVLAALISALPAAAKDGVQATLTTKVPLDAEPGTKLEIGWRLAYVEHGKPHPFGASGVFVRLGSASGAAGHTGFADGDNGRFTATVTVPEDGIGDVQIGLRGFTSGVRSGRSDLLFPITNDPLPGNPRVASPPSPPPASEPPEGGWRTWLLVLAAGVVVAVGAVGAVARRRAVGRTPSPRAGVRPG
jgi:hypothetical protein